MKFVKRFLFVIFSIVLMSPNLIAQKSITYDNARLMELKRAYENRDERVVPHIKALIDFSERYFVSKIFNIAEEKKRIAPSKDPRDYISLSRYWWPNSDTKDGLPYIRHDGKSNPELEEYDHTKITQLENAVTTLGLLYYLTGEERYARRTSEILREMFLDPATGMNPNMTYSQYVPGMTYMRGTGILDSRILVNALNSAKLIEESRFWSIGDKKAMHEWAKTFLYWIENSTQGQMEFNASNNHGLWYDVIRMGLSYFIDDYTHVKWIVENSLYKRLEVQQAKNGSFPEELARTLGLSYTTFALEAFYEAAEIASKTGIDIWTYTSPDGRSISKGVEFAYPYYLEPQKWPYEQISPFEKERGSMALYVAGLKLNNREYINAARKIGYTPESKLKYLLYFDIIKK